MFQRQGFLLVKGIRFGGGRKAVQLIKAVEKKI